MTHNLVHDCGKCRHSNTTKTRRLRPLFHAERSSRGAPRVDGVHHIALAAHLLDHALRTHKYCWAQAREVRGRGVNTCRGIANEIHGGREIKRKKILRY